MIIVVASYYGFYIETHAEFPSSVAVSMREEIVGGVVRHRDFFAKKKFFAGVFAGGLRKFMLVKISCCLVVEYCV